MPTYSYVCSKCGHEFEKFQSMKDDALTVCPQDLCGQKRWGHGKVRRQLGSGAGMIFKGSGFYITDYGKGDGTASKGNATEESSTPSSDTKSESKGETKKPAKSAGTGASKKSE